MSKSLTLTSVSGYVFSVVDTSVRYAFSLPGSVIRLYYINKVTGEDIDVGVTSGSFTSAIASSKIITLTTRDDQALYVNADIISLIETDDSLAKISIYGNQKPYLLSDTVSEVNDLIDVAGGGGGGDVSSVFSRTGDVVAQPGDYTAEDVGLGNVDNTSDADKPVSTATQGALDIKLDVDVNDKTEAGTSYTLLEDDGGLVIHFTSDSAVTITLPDTFTRKTQTAVIKEGMGDLLFTTSGSASILSQGTDLVTQYSAASIIHKGSGVFLVLGNLTT
jgi:hypothetical protein